MLWVAVGAIAVSASLYYWYKHRQPASAFWSAEQAMGNVAASNTSGSGYRDLEGLTMSYNYVGFGSFQLCFFDNRLKWKGIGPQGYFVDVVAMVDLQVSKVGGDNGVYFLSWTTPGGGDNVVINLQEATVYAHLYSGPHSINETTDFAQIHGSILEQPSKNAKLFPDERPSNLVSLLMTLHKNTQRWNLPSLTKFQPQLVQAHEQAKNELLNRTIVFENTTIVVEGEQTYVTVRDPGKNSTEERSFRTHVTKVGKGIYFVSWLADKTNGKHIVVNTIERKVFDHILPGGTLREERIYKLDKFEQNHSQTRIP